MTQIGNNISKSGASILSRTALNIGDTENLVMDQLEALQRREHRDTRDFSAFQKRSCQLKEGKEARKCCKNAQNKNNRYFCTTILFKSQDWYLTNHGSRTSPQDDGDKPIIDLAQSQQTLYVHTLTDVQTCHVHRQIWYEHVVG